MKGFLAGVGAATVLFALTSFAYWSGKAERVAQPPPTARRTGPLRIEDLTLDRAFRQRIDVPLVGSALAVPFPPTVGVVIRSLTTTRSGDPDNGSLQVHMAINGTPDERVMFGLIYGYNSDADRGQTVTLDPPLVVRPGDALTMWFEGLSASQTSLNLTIGGYFVYPGEV